MYLTPFLFQDLQAGESQAARQVWDRFSERLVNEARRRMRGSPRRAVDEEDVALSAFEAFFQGVADGRFDKSASLGPINRANLSSMTYARQRSLKRHWRQHESSIRHAAQPGCATDLAKPSQISRCDCLRQDVKRRVVPLQQVQIRTDN